MQSLLKKLLQNNVNFDKNKNQLTDFLHNLKNMLIKKIIMINAQLMLLHIMKIDWF